ncbi:hypothetical protein E5S67_02462 [Microcoleus sp. IPMA8]|uniref:Uncharacterized protein n=1 Tax=Microcoleus asticus IPMA8 TaxID=2563858 RepID=A0ABX2CWF5_9CYAN|nr:hypothetical protein [Microcoleus asticus IPMA8]
MLAERKSHLQDWHLTNLLAARLNFLWNQISTNEGSIFIKNTPKFINLFGLGNEGWRSRFELKSVYF